MKLLDFLFSLPAEEKDFFLNLLEQTRSLETAVRRTMLILAESEPKLARDLEDPVREWLKISGPLLQQKDSDADSEVLSPGPVSFEPE